jgi:hypothetical protein
MNERRVVLEGCAVAQAVSRRSVAGEARVTYHPSYHVRFLVDQA